MSDRTKDELDALLSALDADGVAAPSPLADALSQALASGRWSCPDPDTVDIAALLGGTLDDGERAALVSALVASESARADLAAADELLQSVSQARGGPP